ncbi:AAA family ATPase [Sorangium sp. So ce1078]|uniref:AAA family ATPase n=1 Tax=Sorangium sp. So ce1078 TaxID=3133329 RepID=UPI003F5F3AF1
MIQQVSFTNFKSLRRVDAHLGRFMVIVGPNGSGKTSILEGLHYLAQATRLPLAGVMQGAFAPPNLKSRGSPGPMALVATGGFHDVNVEVGIIVHCKDDSNGDASWSGTVVRRWGDTGEETSETTEGAQPLVKPADQRPRPPPPPARKDALRRHGRREMAELARELGSARKLRLDIERLAAPSYSEEETPRLDTDGSGLASVLADAAARTPEAFQSIQEAARRVIPTLERIRTRRAKVQRQERQEIRIDGEEAIRHPVDRVYWGHQVVLDFKGAPDIPAPLASEGTLLVIGLLTALWMEPKPRLLLLDDIDKALHPRAQEELVAQIRKILEMSPELQVIATSHSPYLLDHFDAQDVLLTALLPDGSTACARLTDHPDFDRWKSTTRSGELWSFVGEDWVAQQASAAQEHE